MASIIPFIFYDKEFQFRMSFFSHFQGVNPHPAKKKQFFQTNVKNTKKKLNQKNIFLYCHPCLSIGSKEIFINKEEEKNPVRGGGGGVKAYRTYPLKSGVFFF